MSYYQRHMFICTNQRDNGEACCAQANAQAMVDHAKARVKTLGIAGAGQVRVQKAGCLDRCNEGPVAVVYPEGVWYTFVDSSDIDDIIDTHLVGGEVVERLKI
jgi:(2Fe-2S) ferredoxin